jgi:tRNA pseudouridine55 synthase
MSFHGLLVIDKPNGITSRDAVDRAAAWFPPKTKVGHAGTLDPLATGVLVLAVGYATRLIEYVQAMPKTYRTRIILGAISNTDDADGTITATADAKPADEATIRSLLTRFVGEIEQVPPAYSAALVGGRRAYEMARRGQTVALGARRVRIDRVELLSYDWPELELDVYCGKGTYIRSIARDLGAAIGVGGYVVALRRLRIGSFSIDDSVALDADVETARSKLLPMSAAIVSLPAIRVSADEVRRLQQGQAISASGEGEVAVLDRAGDLVAVGRIMSGRLRPEKVIPISTAASGP